MFRAFLKLYFPVLLPVCLPAIYCLLCSRQWEWSLILRLVGGIAVVWVIAETARLPIRRRWRRLIGAAAGFFWLVLSVAEAISFQHSGNSFDLKYLHHFSLISLREGSAGVWQTVLAGGLILIAGTVGAGLLAGGPAEPSGKKSIFRWLAGFLLMLGASPAVPAAVLLYRVQRAAAVSVIDAASLDQAGIKNSLPDREHVTALPGKNLVLIYLESLENHYFDESRYPGLLPNLSQLRAASVDFTNITPARNADFTFGGIYSSLTGGILTTAHYAVSGTYDGRNNSGYDPDLGSRLAGVPGILQKAGYFQMLLSGGDPRFAGLDIFARGAGYDRVFSALQIWRELGYREFPHAVWGVRDRVLLKLGNTACSELAKQPDRPFLLTILTVDPHHPDGFIEPDGPLYTGRGKNVPDLLHAIHALDQAIGRFVRELQQLPVWKDTVVVFLTDHLAMRNSLWQELQDGRERKLVFFALNAGSVQKIPVPGKTFDAAPTILALLGVKHNAKFPLGENLLDSPSPLRLRGDLPENEPKLTGVLRQFSGGGLEPDFPVSFRRTPYPALVLGSRVIPLFTEWGIPQLPQGEECFAVRISGGRRISEARRFGTQKELSCYLANQPGGSTYVVLQADGKEGFIVRRGIPGKWQVVQSGQSPLQKP